MIRYEITFTGRVQGVGFRYTTVHIARDHKVTGWVRNEPDGSVRCVVEGEQAELDRFVVAIERAMNGYIYRKQLQESSASGEFTDFVVRR